MKGTTSTNEFRSGTELLQRRGHYQDNCHERIWARTSKKGVNDLWARTNSFVTTLVLYDLHKMLNLSSHHWDCIQCCPAQPVQSIQRGRLFLRGLFVSQYFLQILPYCFIFSPKACAQNIRIEFWHQRKFENGRFQKTYVAIVFIGQLLLFFCVSSQ